MSGPDRFDAEIRPFRIDVPQRDVDDLKDRLTRTRWPDEPPYAGWDRGVPFGYLKDLADHWATQYDWREHEATLNRFPQFTTTIDGQTTTCMSVVRAERVAAVITHGYRAVRRVSRSGPLTDPRATGATRQMRSTRSFHRPRVRVLPPASPTPAGFTRTAEAWVELMRRPGTSATAHGGDIGAGVAGDPCIHDPVGSSAPVNTDPARSHSRRGCCPTRRKT
jgi:hypothetical protein